MSAPTCGYCGLPAILVTGADIYRARPDLKRKKIWVCIPCDARVGCHPGTEDPLGYLANAELRRARMLAHAAFDETWDHHILRRRQSRTDAYAWLSRELGVPLDLCHIGGFDLEMCLRVVAVCEARKP